MHATLAPHSMCIRIITNTITHIEIYEGQTRQFNQVLKLLKLLGNTYLLVVFVPPIMLLTCHFLLNVLYTCHIKNILAFIILTVIGIITA